MERMAIIDVITHMRAHTLISFTRWVHIITYMHDTKACNRADLCIAMQVVTAGQLRLSSAACS